jgi:hypothetical protein
LGSLYDPPARFHETPDQEEPLHTRFGGGTSQARLVIQNRMSTFMPHLWASVEHEVAQPIFLIAIVGQDHYRRVDLADGIERLPEKQQVELVASAARRHFDRNQGNAGPFGTIVGYVYHPDYDHGWTLNTKGELVNRNAGRVRRGEYKLTLKNEPNRDISFLFNLRRKQNPTEI